MLGNHDVFIVGIGDFGGRATAVFNIYDPSFSEGSGTEDDPYIIRTTDDMDIIASKVYGGNDLNGYHFQLAANLDYTGKTYNVIGNISKIFRGNFDGNGHTISNVTSMSYVSDNVGIFGWLGEGAVVQNVHLSSSNMDLPARSCMGGIVGYNQGGRVAYCTVSDDVSISGSTEVGGIVGYCLGGTIEGCVNKANVTGRYSLVGGIAGYVNTATGINNNLNFGAIVSTNGRETIGGITGDNNNSTVQNNYYTGACATGGIHGSDVAGQAMKGWVVSATDGIFVQQMPDEDYNFTGITYDGIIYLGAGQTGYFIVGRIDGSAGNFAPSAGTLTAVSSAVFPENYYSLAMPTEGQDVVISSTDIALFVSGYGTSADGGYRFIASPVAGSIEAASVGNIFLWEYDLYRFDQTQRLEWRNHDIEPFELENGQGYLYAAETDITLLFGGTYNEAETQDVPLVYDANAQFAGWNLVGNPFPVAAYANRSYYTMNAEGTGIEPNLVSSATAIPACTGVMVKADGANQSVTFSRTAPEAALSQGNIQIAVAQANTRGNAVEDKAIVSFNEGDELGKFVFNEDNAKLYIPQGGKDYAIAVIGRDAARHVSTSVPVNFKAAKNGTYTLTVNVDGMDLDYLHLIDNMTGADVDLLATEGGDAKHCVSTYTFAAKTADYASRFRLVFSKDAHVDNGDDAPFAYISNGEIVINDATNGATLQIVDVLGRVVVCTDVARNVSTSGIVPGVYVLRLIAGDSVRTQKIVIP